MAETDQALAALFQQGRADAIDDEVFVSRVRRRLRLRRWLAAAAIALATGVAATALASLAAVLGWAFSDVARWLAAAAPYLAIGALGACASVAMPALLRQLRS